MEFGGQDDYTNNTPTQMGNIDPVSKTFGPGKATADLSPGEAHVTLNGDAQYVWDADGATWVQISGTGSITAGDGLTKSGNTINLGNGGTGNLGGLAIGTDTIALALLTSGGLKLTSGEVGVEPADFAGTGLEDDGSDNLRLAAQGNGIAGGAGSTLSVQADGTTGGNIQPVNVVANGVGLDVSAIAGTGLEADGSANLRIAAAAAGAGLTGGAGSALAVDGSEATFKEPARVRQSTNVTLSGGAPDTVDSVALAVGNRILVDGQSTASEDGIYEVSVLGTGADGTWVRTADAPAGGEAAGWYIQVLEGSTHGDTLFRVDADLGGATIGTDYQSAREGAQNGVGT